MCAHANALTICIPVLVLNVCALNCSQRWVLMWRNSMQTRASAQQCIDQCFSKHVRSAICKNRKAGDRCASWIFALHVYINRFRKLYEIMMDLIAVHCAGSLKMCLASLVCWLSRACENRNLQYPPVLSIYAGVGSHKPRMPQKI